MTSQPTTASSSRPTTPEPWSAMACNSADILSLDDLIDTKAYDDSILSASIESKPEQPPSPAVQTSFRPGNLLVPSQSGLVALSQPVPPPPSQIRRQDPALIHHRITHPPKEACTNLSIKFPSIPESGTKSRVETQIRLTCDLADTSSSFDALRYDRVGSWQWLKLPDGTTTKKRLKKQENVDPDPVDTLYLSTTVTCASAPYSTVVSCTSCKNREAKRVAKKLASRVKPVNSDSENLDNFERQVSSQPPVHEDTDNILHFNCSELVEMSTGSVVLPLRITCYCRHHREKVGFNVHFTLLDGFGRVIATGTTPPIMITDDHKSTAISSRLDNPTAFPLDYDWSKVGLAPSEITNGVESPSQKRTDTKPKTASKARKRTKPYDSSAKPKKAVSRKGSVSSAPSPSSVSSPATSHSALPSTRSPTPPTYEQILRLDAPAPLSSQIPPLQSSSQESESSPDVLATPLDYQSDVPMLPLHGGEETDTSLTPGFTSTPHQPLILPIIPADATLPEPVIPAIHRLIPSSGPTHGGIEVTVLGTNFHPSFQLKCMFGDTAAASVHHWSENTLVCILPPRAAPGVVAVWFDGFPKADERSNGLPSMFTYTSESDRALMELALQVVGLKMTGKLEDAKNVAMRIVGNSGEGGSSEVSASSNPSAMQIALATRELGLPSVDTRDFETIVLEFLRVLDTPVGSSSPSITTSRAISHQTSSGQTLLHISAFLKFTNLTHFLIRHNIDLDVRDSSGYTALHFAALSGSKECALILLAAGADTEVVNALGKNPVEIAPAGFFDNLLPADDASSDGYPSDLDDDEAGWGDIEDDVDMPTRSVLSRRVHKRTSGKSTPQSRSGKNSSTSLSQKTTDEKSEKTLDFEDDKEARSLMEMLHSKLFQIPVAQGLMHNIPLPHMFPLPQLPLVFPMFGYRGGEESGNETEEGNVGSMYKAAQDWRATWDKWMAVAIATTLRQQQELNEPPPVYTPRASELECDGSKIASSSKTTLESPSTNVNSSLKHPSVRSGMSRRAEYKNEAVSDNEVDAYGYEPSAKRKQKLQKKQDRMLLLFWIPVLLISMLWMLHSGVKFALSSFRNAVTLKG